ncbi:small acid-soluble spore protein Tlp [Lederbergia lenta]|nr:small acid-soluble spore protein Tlp [Lederbergia lenta]MCM3109703.1 small acid-soluble spore protein Tlp [Lederbergia lenta]MEC2324546.1 small acid-soluble spore protein Tlp [Lederbergia lenta]
MTKMEHNKPKPDDRSDNVEKLQEMVQNTIENMEEAEETIQFSDGEDIQQVKAKNKRRQASIESMQAEMKDEAEAENNKYQ